MRRSRYIIREPIALEIDRMTIAEAKEFGMDISAIAETALADAVRAEKERRWLEENREAIDSLNRWVEENGLPFAEYRRF